MPVVQPGLSLLPSGHLAMSGDDLVVTAELDAIGIPVGRGEVRGAAKYRTRHRIHSHDEESSGPKCS